MNVLPRTWMMEMPKIMFVDIGDADGDAECASSTDCVGHTEWSTVIITWAGSQVSRIRSNRLSRVRGATVGHGEMLGETWEAVQGGQGVREVAIERLGPDHDFLGKATVLVVLDGR